MWIKSKCEEEVLADIKAFEIEKDEGKFYITGYLSGTDLNKYFHLGCYKTREKALSVLHDLLCRIGRTESGVFQMPEDDE